MKRCSKIKSIFILALTFMLVITMFPTTAFAKKSTNPKNNLLKNGSFEKWKEDKDGYKTVKNWKEGNKKVSYWAAVENEKVDVYSDSYTGGKDVFDGKYVAWPTRSGVDKTFLYQDVSVTKKMIGKTLELSGLLCNYSQSPNDEAILRIELYNSQGKLLASKQASQRNPQWVKQRVQIVVPKKAAKVRVKLIANRYVGNDNDAYFDDIRLQIVKSTSKKLTLSGNKNAKAGSTDTIKIKGGRTTKATDYKWDSSYSLYATVSKKGVVTFTDEYDPKVGVTIYATDKKTKEIVSFTYGKSK